MGYYELKEINADGTLGMNQVNKPHTAPPIGGFVRLLKLLVEACSKIANALARPIVINRLSPIQIPFQSTTSVGRQFGPGQNQQEPGDGNNQDENTDGENGQILPGGSAGWGPVSGGYWGLDGEFHTWDGVPPIPPPPPSPFPSEGGSDSNSSNDNVPETLTPEEVAEAEAREERIRELEREMERILEEMHIMWPLLEDLLKEEFEARRREILELDPDWHPPGTRPPLDDDDIEAPPLNNSDDPFFDNSK